MTFEDGLLQDLAQAAAFGRWQGGDTTSAAPRRMAPDNLRQLALMRSELLQVGAVASIVASAANRKFRIPASASALDEFETFRPAFAGAGVARAEHLAALAEFFTLAQLWQLLTAQLSFAVALTSGVLRSGTARQDLDADEIVADAWQRVLKAMLSLHTHIAAVMADEGLVCDRDVEGPALGLLQAASLGEWPCFDATGRLSVAGWAERRVAVRRAVTMPIAIELAGRRHPALLRDVSGGGLGAELDVLIPERSNVVIHCGGGRSLTGQVGWAKGRRIGIALAVRLSDDDPLLNAAPPAGSARARDATHKSLSR